MKINKFSLNYLKINYLSEKASLIKIIMLPYSGLNHTKDGIQKKGTDNIEIQVKLYSGLEHGHVGH